MNDMSINSQKSKSKLELKLELGNNVTEELNKNSEICIDIEQPLKINTNSSKENATQIEDSIKSIEGKYNLKSRIQDNFIIDKIKNLNIKKKSDVCKSDTKFVGLKFSLSNNLQDNSNSKSPYQSQQAEKFLHKIFSKEKDTLFTDLIVKRKEFNRYSKSDKIEFFRKNISQNRINNNPILIKDSNLVKRDNSSKRKLNPNIEADSLEDLVINRRLKLPHSFKKKSIHLPKIPIIINKSNLVKITKNEDNVLKSTQLKSEKEHISHNTSVSNLMKIDDKSYSNKGVQSNDIYFSDSLIRNFTNDINDLYFKDLCNNNQIYCKVIRLNNKNKGLDFEKEFNLNMPINFKENKTKFNIEDSFRKPLLSKNKKLGKALSNSRFLSISKDVQFPSKDEQNSKKQKNDSVNFKSNSNAIKLGFPPTKLNKILNTLNEKTEYNNV